MIPAVDAWAVADPTTCPVCNRDACDEHLPAGTGAGTDRASAPGAPRLKFQTAAEVINAKPPVEIVEAIAWVGGKTVLVSESGTGKTFVLLDLSAAVSAGLPWHGRYVTRGSVAYCSFEGDALGIRLSALREHTGHKLEHVHIVRAHDPISPRVTRDGEERSIGEVELCAALEALDAELRAEERPPIVLIVIDTVRASLAGSEDSSEHVSAYLRAVGRILACVPGAAIILTHHAGWQDGESQKKRERGSSAWRGNCDATLYLEAGEYDAERGEAELTMRTLKVRDAERPAPLHFIRKRVELTASTRRMEPVTSCIIVPDRRTREDRDAEAAEAANRANSDLDLKTLRILVEHPAASTSQNKLRDRLGVNRDVAIASINRVVDRGWAKEPEKQRQPYTVTEAGRQALL